MVSVFLVVLFFSAECDGEIGFFSLFRTLYGQIDYS